MKSQHEPSQYEYEQEAEHRLSDKPMPINRKFRVTFNVIRNFTLAK